MNIVAIRQALIDHVLSLGMFTRVAGHEPKAAPVEGGLTAALWASSIGPARARSGLDSTTLRVEFSIRIMVNLIEEPQDDIDERILVACLAVMDAYSGDFDLGQTVQEVDLLGEAGTPLSMQAGYLDQDGRKFRVAVITIPLIVCDVFDQNP